MCSHATCSEASQVLEGVGKEGHLFGGAHPDLWPASIVPVNCILFFILSLSCGEWDATRGGLDVLFSFLPLPSRRGWRFGNRLTKLPTESLDLREA